MSLLNQQLPAAQVRPVAPQPPPAPARPQTAAPEYGDNPNDYPPGTTFVERWYIAGSQAQFSLPVLQSYLQVEKLDKGWDGVLRSARYISPSTADKQEAQRWLLAVLRGAFAQKVQEFLGTLTQAQFERGAVAEAELDLADRLREYLKEIGQ